MSTETSSWKTAARRKFFAFRAAAEGHRARYGSLREMLSGNDAQLRRQRDHLAELERSHAFAGGDGLTVRHVAEGRRKIAELEATAEDLRRQMDEAEREAGPASRLKHDAGRILFDLGIIGQGEI